MACHTIRLNIVSDMQSGRVLLKLFSPSLICYLYFLFQSGKPFLFHTARLHRLYENLCWEQTDRVRVRTHTAQGKWYWQKVLGRTMLEPVTIRDTGSAPTL